MDVRKLFSDSADAMLAGFREAEAFSHQGTKGTVREDVLARFLRDRIPARFGIGNGQIIGPNSPDSRQSDVILYDTNICAPIVASAQSQLYPVEGVSGIIEVKSRLSKKELLDGLGKIADFKRLVPRDYVRTRFGMVTTNQEREKPFGIVFAYSLADNSLESLESNIQEFERDLEHSYLAPNLVVVLNEGIILHTTSKGLRNVVLSDDLAQTAHFLIAYSYRRGTLFEFYTMLLDMLMNTQLSVVQLAKYRSPVERLGKHIVRNHDRLFNRGDTQRFRLTANFIAKVVTWCSGQKKLSNNELNRLIIPDAPGVTEMFAAEGPPAIYLYNPDKLPRMTMEMVKSSVNGRVKEPCLVGTFFIEIDGEDYAIPGFYTHENSEPVPGASMEDVL